MLLKQSVSIVLIFIVACTATQNSFKDSYLVFGTIVDIEIVGVSNEKAQFVSNLIEQEFNQLHQDWHAWQPGGLLAKINQAISQGQPISLSKLIIQFLKTTQQLSRKSDYLFNPAIGNLVALWGFHGKEKQTIPPLAKLDIFTKPVITMDSLIFAQDKLIAQDNRVKIDLGGIAKGYAIDIAIKILTANGVQNALVNAGGDLHAIGKNNKNKWRIAVRHPQGGIIGLIELLNNESVFSSGDYQRTYSLEQQKVHHIINPFTGRPSTGISAVTVIHSNPIVADAAATAIMVAGIDKWQQVAIKMGVNKALVVDNAGKLIMTKAMSNRIKISKSLD